MWVSAGIVWDTVTRQQAQCEKGDWPPFWPNLASWEVWVGLVWFAGQKPNRTNLNWTKKGARWYKVDMKPCITNSLPLRPHRHQSRTTMLKPDWISLSQGLTNTFTIWLQCHQVVSMDAEVRKEGKCDMRTVHNFETFFWRPSKMSRNLIICKSNVSFWNSIFLILPFPRIY